MRTGYPSCHVHPDSLDSASTLEAFADREQELGTGVLVATDHGSLGSCMETYKVAHERSLTPILGVEAYFRDDDCQIFKAAGIPKKMYEPGTAGYERYPNGSYIDYFKYAHLTIHALDQAAYEALVRLISKADARAERHGQERKPLFDWATLEELGSYNMTMTSGCLVGMVQRHLLDNDNPELALKYYEKLKAITKPGNFYVEVFPHVCDKNWVKGCFITLEDGQVIKYHDKKKIRTNVGEIEIDALAVEFNRKDNKHEALLAIKDYRTWVDRQPLKITKVSRIEAFVDNECRDWAPDGDVQLGCNRFMIAQAESHNDPILIADDSHFARPDEKIVQDIRLQAGGGSWRFYGSYHRQDSAESFGYFKNKLGISEGKFDGWIDNCYNWADRFKGFKLDYKPSLPTKFYEEEYKKHVWFEDGNADNSLQYALELIRKHGRMDWSDPKWVDRLQTEIKLLHYNGTIDLLPYFFLGEDVVSLYNRNGLLTGVGRGSSAGLAIAYLFGITHVDPLKYDLSLNRFITLDRILSGKLPDIDQDLPNRELLVDPEDPEKGWLWQRFGDHARQISTKTTLKLRSSVKDVARVTYGKVPEDIEQLTKKFQNAPQGVLDKDFVFGYDMGEGWVQGSIETDEALKQYVKKYPSQWAIVQKCLGLSRQKSRHPCGYCVMNSPVYERIPTTSIGDVVVTQYTSSAVEAAGGVKMDFLTLNSLNDIADCIKMIQNVEIPEELAINGRQVPRIRIVPHKGRLYDIWDLPDDQVVFNEVAEGKTETVFQFNTSGAIQWMRHFNHEIKPGVKGIDSIPAMAIFTALDRPGPLDVIVNGPDGKPHNMLVEYARRLRGEVHSKTPDLFNKMLPETLGILIYQESLEKIYKELTGCTGAEAEEFRSNVAKKKAEKINKAYPVYMEKATARFGKEAAQEAWDAIQTWSAYGFSKNHAICYATIGYACAFLKHHYPLQWWCSVLKNASKNEINDKFWAFCDDIIDLPDVKLSGPTFEVQNARIRAPIALLHGIGETAHAQLLAGLPYTDIKDFCQKIQAFKVKNGKLVTKTTTNKKGITTTKTSMRLGRSALTRKIVYNLIISGAMDSLFPVGMDVLEQLTIYETNLAAATESKFSPVPENYLNINQLVRYQMRKAVLPAYSTTILPMLKDRSVTGLEEDVRYTYYRTTQDRYPFVTATQIEAFDRVKPWPLKENLNVAVAAYVEKTRKFAYQNKTKEALEVILNVDGQVMKFVKWGGKKGVPKKFDDITGSIVVAILSKFAEDRPFAVDEIFIVQAPLDTKPEEIPEESP